MPILLDIFLTFLKIGVVSFGGGYAMIPMLTDEVLSHGWMTESEILNFIAVSESTPGPVAINMATFVGATEGATLGTFGSFLGALLATLGVVLPAFIIILIVASIMKGLLKYKGVQGFLSGVRPVVIGLIVGTAITLFITVVIGYSKVNRIVDFDYKALIIFGVVAVTYLVYKKVKKKSFPPIFLILLSAFLGIILYGFV